MTDYVAYLRVSTEKQGSSGLGLEAQERSIRAFLKPGDKLAGKFVEVETGKHSQRPQLQEAMRVCRATGATLLVAKLDRLSRNLAFIAALMESQTKFVACDMPHADPLRLHIEAAVAEDERRRISRRTREALAAARARGVKLGGARENSGFQANPQASAKAHATRRAHAREHAEAIRPYVEAALANGVRTPWSIAQYLNERRVAALRGGTWGITQVKRLLEQLKIRNVP